MIKKTTLLIFCVLFLSFGSVIAQDTDDTDASSTVPQKPLSYKFPNAKTRFNRYLNETIGPGALAGSAIGATFQQIDNSPPEWKKTGTGFARRFASNLGENAIESTTRYALSEALGQDQKYIKCECSGVSKRALYALKSGFTARNRQGKTVFSPPKVVSPFVGSVTAVKVWYPKRHTFQDGLRRGGYGLAFNVGFNLIREFVFNK